MTDDRSLERAARSWIEAGPTQAPDRAVEAALLRIQTTPQERDLRIPWRLPKMTTPARVAAAAVIGVLAIGGAFYLISPSGRSNVGVPGPSPTASPSAERGRRPSAALVPAAAPATTLGDWQAMSAWRHHRPVRRQRAHPALDRLAGRPAHVDPDECGEHGPKSETCAAPAGEIDLRATSADTIGCAAGDLGRYSWSRSADGMFLTLTVIDDACANRRDAMSRVWVHSLSAVTDGGLGVMPSTPARRPSAARFSRRRYAARMQMRAHAGDETQLSTSGPTDGPDLRQAHRVPANPPGSTQPRAGPRGEP